MPLFLSKARAQGLPLFPQQRLGSGSAHSQLENPFVGTAGRGKHPLHFPPEPLGPALADPSPHCRSYVLLGVRCDELSHKSVCACGAGPRVLTLQPRTAPSIPQQHSLGGQPGEGLACRQ